MKLRGKSLDSFCLDHVFSGGAKRVPNNEVEGLDRVDTVRKLGCLYQAVRETIPWRLLFGR